VPFGKVTATYKIGDEVHEATAGVSRPQLDEHGYRAPRRPLVVGEREVGPYTFIAAHIVATKKYGYTPFHWYMLARDGKPIADDGPR